MTARATILRRQRLPPPDEIVIHIMVADTLRRFANKGWMWTHLPFGEKRSEETGAKLKRMGVKPGWPDFVFINLEGRVYFLELKKEGESLSEDQRLFFAIMHQRRVECRVARSFDDAIRILGKWGVVPVTIPGRPSVEAIA